jgi:hypothetical protein
VEKLAGHALYGPPLPVPGSCQGLGLVKNRMQGRLRFLEDVVECLFRLAQPFGKDGPLM